jgi:hypothetical protein
MVLEGGDDFINKEARIEGNAILPQIQTTVLLKEHAAGKSACYDSLNFLET